MIIVSVCRTLDNLGGSNFSICMSLEEAAPIYAESNEEHIASAVASRELAPTNFYAPPQQNGNPGPAAESGEATTQTQDRSRKRSRSDSDFSEIGEEDAGSDFDAGISADSDDSINRYFVSINLTRPGSL